MTANTLATVIGTPKVSIEINGRVFSFMPLTLADMSEFLDVVDQFNAALELRLDHEAEVKRWEMRCADWDARFAKGENLGPAPGPKPERPEGLRQSSKHLLGTLRLLWAAIRKSGLSEEQVKRKEWAISLEDLGALEWNRIDEVNELLNVFFRRGLKGKQPTQAETAT